MHDIDTQAAPPVSLDLARVFASRDDAEAYIERVEPCFVAILPFPGGCVIGHVAASGALLGYEA